MSDQFVDALEKIKGCMLLAGDIPFSDSCVKDVSVELLRPTEDTVVDHWKVFQGATAYYSYLLNQAISAQEEAENELKIASLRCHSELFELAKNKYMMSRPSKDDLLVIGIVEGKKDLEELRDNLRYWQDAVRHLESWMKTWEKKSFCLNGISQANQVNVATIRSPRVD